MGDRPDAPGGFPPQFYKYWGPGGDGGALIKWDTPGDFARCCTAVNAKITEKGGKPLPDGEIRGLCSNLHLHYTGGRPGHGPAEQALTKAKDDRSKT